jgi:NAD(P)H-hydrate repair Nnr-like enzyme with NAD(P)H-hydrate dehydratase domain
MSKAIQSANLPAVRQVRTNDTKTARKRKGAALALQRVRTVPRLARRGRQGHKGNYGHVLIVGGSRGMSGAVAMASQSALRGGAGLVTFAAPSAVQLVIAGLCPCATSVALSCDAEGSPDAGAVRQVLRAAGGCDVLAAGPGMGVGAGQRNIVRAMLEQERPLVIDADGLNNLAKIDGWAELRKCPMVLTPHPGEFARLTGRTTADVQADRVGSAVAAARAWGGNETPSPFQGEVPPSGGGEGGHAMSIRKGRGVRDPHPTLSLRERGLKAVRAREKAGTAPNSRGENWVQSPFSQSPFSPPSSPVSPLVLVLKGAGTVVTDGRRVYVNTTGNPGMATGGSGDILTGLIAALMGQAGSAGSRQELTPFEAACLGVYVHGLAGDLGAADLGEVSLTAWDLLDYLPAAMKTVVSRR